MSLGLTLKETIELAYTLGVCFLAGHVTLLGHRLLLYLLLLQVVQD